MPLERLFVLRTEQNAQALHAFLKANWRSLADAGTPLACSIAEHKAKRNTKQNRLYWALLNDISANAWVDGKQYSADAWHEWAKQRFIGCEETPGGGKSGISTTTLDVGSFADFITKLQAYAATDLGLELL